MFPVQMAILLSEPDDDFSGGEFVLTEQRPRMQSRGSAVPLRKGDAVIVSVNRRPAKGGQRLLLRVHPSLRERGAGGGPVYPGGDIP
jgi:hypothetical protein